MGRTTTLVSTALRNWRVPLTNSEFDELIHVTPPVSFDMPIQVTCPKCHARFKVSEKFAGQKGPCPKCKNPIQIPEVEDEIVIHAPDEFGPKDSSGKATLKPIEREDSTVSPIALIVIAGSILVTIVAAYLIGKSYSTSETGVPMAILGVGAVLLGPPLAYACYWFLRNPELEPHRGSVLLIRSLICGLIYAVLWGLYAFLALYLFEGDVAPVHLAFVAPVLVAGGATAALASFDIDFVNGIFHYGVYLAVTVFMRYLMGMGLY